MNVGDIIKCKDPKEMVDLMYALNYEGIETDFMYEKDGKRGLWLEVMEINEHGCKRAN